MSVPITFTLDLEDHRPHDGLPKRYPEIVDQLLDFLDAHKIKATVFTVGTLAEQDPALVKRIHDAGHEIGHHSYDHTPLTRQSPSTFKSDTARAKNILEDVTGAPVNGYRAPVFSLTRDTLWAVDILKELGFIYSSSIVPARNPLHGLHGAPRKAFKWSNGLLEIPAPVGRIGPATLPYLGGFYFRYLPLGTIQKQIRKSDAPLWTYCHPYDFDAGEKNWRIKGAAAPVSLLLWLNRSGMMKKLESLATNNSFAPPFRDQTFPGDLPKVDPATL